MTDLPLPDKIAKFTSLLHRHSDRYSPKVMAVAKKRLLLVFWLTKGRQTYKLQLLRDAVSTPEKFDTYIDKHFWNFIYDEAIKDGIPLRHDVEWARKWSISQFGTPVPWQKFPLKNLCTKGRWLRRTHYRWLNANGFIPGCSDHYLRTAPLPDHNQNKDIKE